MYTCSGLFVNEDRNEGWLVNPVNAANVTVYTSWQLVGGDPDANYYLSTYNYTLKADNTYAITAEDREALVLYIPATHPTDGKPVTEIADGAFSGLSEVTKVDFSAAVNLTEIGSSAFYACTTLGEVVGDENLTKLAKVGSDAFYGTAWMNGKSSGEGDVAIGNVLVRYMGEDTKEIDLSGTEYKYIAEYALSGYKNVTTIALPDTIVRIDDNTLGIASLEKVTAATGIEYIGRKAFESSVMISGQSDHIVIGNVFYLADNAKAAADGGVVTIPAGVTVIAPGAFAQCTAAKELKFEGGEDKITYIGARAFNGSGIEAADEDGFIIVNGILARYTGSAETVVVPDEVTTVGSYAFGRGVKNIVFRSNSQLSAIEDNAFTNAADLEKIAVYKTGATLEGLGISGLAFANVNGSAAANDTFVLILEGAAADSVAETANGAVAWLNGKGRVQKAGTSDAMINTAVFATEYVAPEGDVFGAVYLAQQWGVTDDDVTAGKAVVANGFTVTRDGITFAEDYVIDKETVEEGLGAATLNGSVASATIALSYGGTSYNLQIKVYPAINSFALDETYPKRDDGKLQMYRSQSTFNTSGNMTYKLAGYTIGGRTFDGADNGSVKLADPAVTVTGYSNNVGVYVGEDALKIAYNYHGKVYTASFDYVVSNAKTTEVVPAYTEVVVIPLGASAASYYIDIKMNVKYQDGGSKGITMANVTILSVTGPDGVKVEYPTSLPTSVEGEYTVEVQFRESGSTPVTGTVQYKVDRIPIDGLYTFSYNDADKTATITGVTSQRDFYVLPSETVNPENADIDGYTVTAIGNGAFAGNRLITAYLPDTVTTIGDNAFDGCVNLTSVTQLGSSDEAVFPASVTSIGNYAFEGCGKLNVTFGAAKALTTIGDNAFYGCISLQQVVFAQGSALGDIGKEAFMESGVSVVDLADTKVTKIGYSAFEGCASLFKLTLPETIAEININAFYGCTSLREVFVSDNANITFIGSHAFYNCKFDPSAIKDHAADGAIIESDAFLNCKP